MATNCLRRIMSRKSSPIAKEIRFFSSWSVMYLHVMYSHQWKQTNIVFKSICQRKMEKFYFQYVILKIWDNGCCRNVTALLYQFYEYKEIDLKIAPAQKTCTGVPQKWNIPEEAKNGEATQLAFTCSKLTIETLEHISHLVLVFLMLTLNMYSDFIFEKTDAEKDQSYSRKRVLVGTRMNCACSSHAKTSKGKIRNFRLTWKQYGKS